jgi:hypothetical protein
MKREMHTVLPVGREVQMCKEYEPAQPADHRYTNNLQFQNAEALFVTLYKSIYELNSGLFDNTISL